MADGSAKVGWGSAMKKLAANEQGGAEDTVPLSKARLTAAIVQAKLRRKMELKRAGE